MDSEKLFKYGVKEKDGDGKRYRVLAILPDGLSVAGWEDDAVTKKLKVGEYEIWSPPKSIFHSFKRGVTLGELKKAAEQEQLPDNTRILILTDLFFPKFGDAMVVLGDSADGKVIVVK